MGVGREGVRGEPSTRFLPANSTVLPITCCSTFTDTSSRTLIYSILTQHLLKRSLGDHLDAEFFRLIKFGACFVACNYIIRLFTNRRCNPTTTSFDCCACFIATVSRQCSGQYKQLAGKSFIR